MKKFLTVLLVIAVMFTFSFSSAFAATANPANAQQKANLLEAEKLALTTAEANYKTAMSEMADKTYGSYFKVDKSVWETLSSEAWTKYVEVIQTKTNDAIDNYPAGAGATDTGSTLVGKVYVDANGDDMLTVSSISAWLVATYEVKAAKLQFKNDQADAIAKLDKVDLSIYSATSPKTGDTYRVQAEKAVNAAKETVNGIDIDAVDSNGAPVHDDTTKVRTQYENMFGYVNSVVTPLTIGSTGIESGYYKLTDSSIKTIEEEEKADVTSAADKAALKAEVAKQHAAYITGTDPDKDAAAKAVEMLNFLIDEDVVKSVGAGYVTNWMAGTNFQNNADQIAELEAYAAKYKAEKDANGNLVRDAKDVDDIVKAAKINAFSNVYSLKYDNAADKAKIEKAVKSVNDAELAFDKEVAKTAMEKARKAALKKYYPLEQAKVNAAFDKKIAEIENAKTSAAAKAVTAPSLTGINDKDAIKNILLNGALANEFDKQYANDGTGSLEKYVDYKNAGLTPRSEGYVIDDTLQDKLIELYGEKGARTAAEMKALQADAVAVVDALPTVGGVAAAKAAVEDAIKALPATVTAADKEAVENAWKLAKDYADMTNAAGADYTAKIAATDISNKATLTSKINKLHSAMALDLAKKAAAAGKTDKAALKAAQAEIDAFNDLHEAEEVFEKATKYTDKTVENALEAIKEAELKAVIDAINAIPVNITEADKPAVEAARKLYDAFVAEYTDYKAPGYNAAKQVTNFRDLALAEAALGLNEDPGKDVEGLKITASSTAKKGSITVKWRVKGDTSSVTYYEVRKSTKRNTGFNKPYFKTTKKTYKNTKELKKGTMYYYKVRAVAVIDGHKYKSDWSNKAYRRAK